MTTQSEQLVIPENIQSGDSRWGLKGEISRGIEERICEIPRSIKKEVKFLGVFTKNSCGMS